MKILIGLVISLIVAGSAFATPPTDLPTDLPGIEGVSETSPSPGTWQWDYDVDFGAKPSLSHWELGICKDIYDTLYDFELDGNPFTDVEFKTPEDPDPSTGAIGLKFDDLSGVGIHTFSFKTTKDWEMCDDLIATFKSGKDQVITETTFGPCCEVITNPVPEPASLSLLGLGIIPILRRKRMKLA